MTKTNETAVFGGGCFWCTEAIFKSLKGVKNVFSGYAGGTSSNPSYEEVSLGKTGHAEVIKIDFDSNEISYSDLLDIFFHTHNPTTLNQQGADIGTQYRSIILTTSSKQNDLAQKTVKALNASEEFKQPIVTEIKPLEKFYKAEKYHQDYYQRNSSQRYCQVVISPKIKHLQEKYPSRLKK